MKAMRLDGRGVDVDAPVAPDEAGGMLSKLDAVALRAFLIEIALAGGAMKMTIAGAMRCHPKTVCRNLRASRPTSPSTDP